MKWHESIFSLGKMAAEWCQRVFIVSVLWNEETNYNHSFLFRSVSDVPIKIQELAITISNTKSVYKISAQEWTEIDDVNNAVARNAVENPFGTDFMMQPNKLYKIAFAGEQCQFSENSMLSVSTVWMNSRKLFQAQQFAHQHFQSSFSKVFFPVFFTGRVPRNQNRHGIQLCHTFAKLFNECKVTFQQIHSWMWWTH